MTENPTEKALQAGQVQWHTSEEDGGPDVGIMVGLGGGKLLWCGELLDAEGGGMGLAVSTETAKIMTASLTEWDDVRQIIEDHIAPALTRPPAGAGEAVAWMYTDDETGSRCVVSKRDDKAFPYLPATPLYTAPSATPNSGAEDGVTQGDRMLARQIAAWVNGLSGKEAESFSASAIARHRLTSANTASEREKALIETAIDMAVAKAKEEGAGDKDMIVHQLAYQYLREAIRSLSHTKEG